MKKNNLVKVFLLGGLFLMATSAFVAAQDDLSSLTDDIMPGAIVLSAGHGEGRQLAIHQKEYGGDNYTFFAFRAEKTEGECTTGKELPPLIKSDKVENDKFYPMLRTVRPLRRPTSVPERLQVGLGIHRNSDSDLSTFCLGFGTSLNDQWIQFIDLDGDGYDEIIVSTSHSAKVEKWSVLAYSADTHTFRKAGGIGGLKVEYGDINRDGRQEIWAGFSDGAIKYKKKYHSLTCPPTIFQFDGKTLVDVSEENPKFYESRCIKPYKKFLAYEPISDPSRLDILRGLIDTYTTCRDWKTAMEFCQRRIDLIDNMLAGTSRGSKGPPSKIQEKLLLQRRQQSLDVMAQCEKRIK